LPYQVEEAQIIRQWLTQKRDNELVEILVPHDGLEQELVSMASENAVETLSSLRAQWQADRHRQEQALSELQEALKLPNPLNRIECYDISNTQGTAAVGSMVVFEQGVPKKNYYRRFNIRSVSGPDDFASMEEVLLRRFNRWKAAQETADAPGKKPDKSFALLPDLLIVDGGKGQLSRAVQVLESFELLDSIPVAGLAKQKEELFVHGKSEPILMPERSQGLYLLQRVRDEAHRFAITSHRKLRTKKGIASRLDAIPGIGPARRKVLMDHFGSVDDIRDAPIEELSAVRGITRNLAESIKEHLE
jgi:excinuclease ABC subunit C